MEAAINVVMVHGTILTNLKLEDQVKATHALIITKKKSLADLGKPQTQAHRVDLDALVEAIKEPGGNFVSLQVEAFDHFKKLLCPTLQLQWKDIVSDESDGDTYVSLKGVVPWGHPQA